jgi:excisionase family DNA binding protein
MHQIRISYFFYTTFLINTLYNLTFYSIINNYQLDKSEMDDRWHSVMETARYLGIKQDTLYKWITRKNIPAHKVGRLWKFKLKEVDEWVRQGKAR